MQNTKHLLHPNRTGIIYISTDEKNREFFNPLKGLSADFPGVYRYPDGGVFRLRFLTDYSKKAGLDMTNQNHLGMIEQIICANAHTFFGTPRSSFSGYISRMRGYYRDHRYARTFYTKTAYLYSLHSQTEIVGPFWAREFAVAHAEIDDDDGNAHAEIDDDNDDDNNNDNDDNDDNVVISVVDRSNTTAELTSVGFEWILDDDASEIDATIIEKNAGKKGKKRSDLKLS